MAFDYEVEIRDTDDALVDLLAREITAISWTYESVGGCGQCQITLSRRFDDYGPLALDYDVRVVRKLATGDEVRWAGFIRQITPTLEEPERVSVGCAGYAHQSDLIIVDNQLYGNADVGAIARAIIDGYLTGNTRIKRTAGLNLCGDTGVTVSNQGLRFFNSAYDALKTLGEIGGNAEWGVRADKEAYFMPRSIAVKQTLVIGDRVKFYEPQTSTDDLVHRVYVQGANGSIYTINGGNQPGNAHYMKQRVNAVPALTNANDAALWGTSYMARYNSIQPRGRVVLSAIDSWIENVSGQTMPPLGRLRIQGGPIYTPQGMIGGDTDTQFRIDTITYRPDDNGLNIDIQLGEKRGSLTDLFRGIEFKLGDLRTGVGEASQPPAAPGNPQISSTVEIDPIDGVAKPALDMSWTASPEWDIVSYEVQFRRQGGVATTRYVTGSTSLHESGVISGVVYEFRVQAINRQDVHGAWTSPWVSTTTVSDAIAPAAPTGGSVTAGLQLVVVRWSPPTDADWDVTEVWRSQTNDSNTASKVAEHRGIVYVDDKLNNSTTYYYWLKSRDFSGNVSGFDRARYDGLSATTLQVVTADIANFQVTEDLIAAAAITQNKLAGGSVVNTKIASGAVEADKIAANAVSADKIAANAITTEKIIASAVTGDKIAAYTISADKIGANQIGANELVVGSAIITQSAQIQDGIITNAKIDSLAASKIAAGTVGVGINIAGSNILLDGANNRIDILDGSANLRVRLGYLSVETDYGLKMLDSTGEVMISPTTGVQTLGINANAVTNSGATSSDGQSTVTTETVVASLTISTDGGKVGVWAKCAVITEYETSNFTLRIRKDDAYGAVLDLIELAPFGGTGGVIDNRTLSLMGMDDSPGSSQTYVLTGEGPAGGVTFDTYYRRLIAINLKK